MHARHVLAVRMKTEAVIIKDIGGMANQTG
jgi:hypothetical protein